MNHASRRRGIVLSQQEESVILELAIKAGFGVNKHEDSGTYQLRIGRQVFAIRSDAVYKRLLAELVELTSCRIAYSSKVSYLDTLAGLKLPVLKRAIAQGLQERYGE